jgi:CRP-like cAMP-binding protein
VRPYPFRHGQGPTPTHVVTAFAHISIDSRTASPYIGPALTAVQDILRRTPYFADIEPAQLEAVASAVVERSYRRGDPVFLEGHPCEGLYAVKSGRVRVYKISPEGREQVLLIAGPGDTFNEVPVFDGGPNPASVEALEPTVLLLLPKGALLAMMEAHPEIRRAFMRTFAMRIRQLVGLVEELSFKTVTGRVARILLEQLPSPEGGDQPRRLTQRELAAMAGTAREVAGRALKALEMQGAIRIERGRIVVVDREQLASLGR